MRFMIYGCNGYTGRLATAEAVSRGMRPLLAGRRKTAVARVAAKHGLEHAVFSLDDTEAVARHVAEQDAVLHVAGPFSGTSRPMVDACLLGKTHYLDVTGEISVFEAIYARDDEARAAGVTLLPGVGFDVVPTDCLAARLKEMLPSATELSLAIQGGGGVSKGTTKSTVEALPRGGAIRRNGEIVKVPMHYSIREIPFPDRPRHAMSIPWGDVSTAYYSTGIGNIVVYAVMGKLVRRAAPLLQVAGPLLGLGPVQAAIKGVVQGVVRGPSEKALATAHSQAWGEVRDDAGHRAEGTVVCPQGYRITAVAAVEATRRVLEGQARPGSLTPSMAFGSGFVEELEGCEMRVALVS